LKLFALRNGHHSWSFLDDSGELGDWHERLIEFPPVRLSPPKPLHLPASLREKFLPIMTNTRRLQIWRRDIAETVLALPGTIADLYPLRIMGRKNPKVVLSDDYVLFHNLATFDAIDREASDLNLVQYRYLSAQSIRTIVLDWTLIGTCPIFHLNGFSYLLFCTEVFIQTLESLIGKKDLRKSLEFYDLETAEGLAEINQRQGTPI
jgi:hypothetical protein